MRRQESTDIHDLTPIWHSIRICQLRDYFANLIQPRRALMAFKRQQINIRPVDNGLPSSSQ
ncbi:MAG TPA: hypothetical protein PLB97_05500 [Accumulibacter sp.]|jgi:hypothetical protein|nr:hypothetical protein [Accumulibacter sp.]